MSSEHTVIDGNVTEPLPLRKGQGMVFISKPPDTAYGEVPATLIVWPHTPERIFSQSQVEAMITELRDSTMSSAVDRRIFAIAAKHGLTLSR